MKALNGDAVQGLLCLVLFFEMMLLMFDLMSAGFYMRRLALIGFLLVSFWSMPLFAEEVPRGDIAIYSDSHNGNAVHEQIVDTIIQTQAKVVFHCGDMIGDRKNPADWQPALRIFDKLKAHAEFFPAIGNWDSGLPQLLAQLPMLNKVQWYSVDREGIHFIVLDSNSPLGVESIQYKWLVEDLGRVDGKNTFIIVLFHHPMFTTGYHPRQDQKGLRFVLDPLFEKHGVDAVFSGHDHHYERSLYHGIYYIVTGGGGGMLHGQTREGPYSEFFITENHFCLLTKEGQEITVKVLDTSLNNLDEFTLKKDKGEELRPAVIQSGQQ